MVQRVGLILSLLVNCFDRRHPNRRQPNSRYHHCRDPMEIVLHPRNTATLGVRQMFHHCHHPNLHHLECRHCRYRHHRIRGITILAPGLLDPKLLDRIRRHLGPSLFHHRHCLHN